MASKCNVPENIKHHIDKIFDNFERLKDDIYTNSKYILAEELLCGYTNTNDVNLNDFTNYIFDTNHKDINTYINSLKQNNKDVINPLPQKNTLTDVFFNISKGIFKDIKLNRSMIEASRLFKNFHNSSNVKQKYPLNTIDFYVEKNQTNKITIVNNVMVKVEISRNNGDEQMMEINDKLDNFLNTLNAYETKREQRENIVNKFTHICTIANGMEISSFNNNILGKVKVLINNDNNKDNVIREFKNKNLTLKKKLLISSAVAANSLEQTIQVTKNQNNNIIENFNSLIENHLERLIDIKYPNQNYDKNYIYEI